jgi:hypothetical protein
MKEESHGYVELEWVCPNCDGKNKGSKKTCESCGAPQPENVKFQRAADEKIITDEKQIAAAKAGADIHCGFCGTRNPGNAVTCSQCGGDLKEGKARQAGQVLQASTAPKVVTCKNCGTENPSSERLCVKCGSPLPKTEAQPPLQANAQAATTQTAQPKKTNWLLIGGIVGALLLCCVAFAVLLMRPSKSVQGTVTNVEWQTSVPVEEMQPVNYTHRSGSAPSAAYNVSCQTESQEICEEKTIDKGNGFAEVVKECHTEDTQYCDYTVDEWKTIQTYTLNGTDTSPVYDNPTLANGQRLGATSETLTVYFKTPNGQETYIPGSLSEFQQFEVGSTWKLTLNAIGSILSVER